ncbi:hypothetical protein C3L33_09345, partial [Rhododendron williamsianum]
MANYGLQTVEKLIAIFSHQTQHQNSSPHGGIDDHALITDLAVTEFKKIISSLDRTRTGHARFRKAPLSKTRETELGGKIELDSISTVSWGGRVERIDGDDRFLGDEFLHFVGDDVAGVSDYQSVDDGDVGESATGVVGDNVSGVSDYQSADGDVVESATGVFAGVEKEVRLDGRTAQFEVNVVKVWRVQ